MIFNFCTKFPSTRSNSRRQLFLLLAIEHGESRFCRYFACTIRKNKYFDFHARNCRVRLHLSALELCESFTNQIRKSEQTFIYSLLLNLSNEFQFRFHLSPPSSKPLTYFSVLVSSHRHRKTGKQRWRKSC